MLRQLDEYDHIVNTATSEADVKKEYQQVLKDELHNHWNCDYANAYEWVVGDVNV